MTKPARDLEVGDRFKDDNGIWKIVKSLKSYGLYILVKDETKTIHVYYPHYRVETKII